MSKASLKLAAIEMQKTKAKGYLEVILPVGSEIYLLTKRHTNQGASLVAYLAVVDGRIRNITAHICELLNLKWDNSDAVWTGDSFHIIMEISYAIHGTKNKGRINIRKAYLPSTDKFKAGYSLRHTVL